MQFVLIGVPLFYYSVNHGTLFHVWMSMNTVSLFGGLVTVFMLARLDYDEQCQRAKAKAYAEDGSGDERTPGRSTQEAKNRETGCYRRTSIGGFLQGVRNIV